MLEDVLGWTVILVGGIIIYFWDNYIIDPIMTIGFTVFVLWGVARNLKSTCNIFMQGVPEHIDIDQVKHALLKIKEIKRVHDVHIWSLEGETDIFSGHIVVEKDALQKSDNIKKKIKYILAKYHIEHPTIELESEEFCSGVECENNNSK